MKIALVSEHASPLASLGGVDAGGQNVHVGALAAALAACDHDVVVYTRRDSPALPRRVRMSCGAVVEHVDAGPAKPIVKDAIYEHVPAFAAHLTRAWRHTLPDIVHSHFWMSGLAALAAAKPLGVPVVHTYHALGAEKRRHQGAADTSPLRRIFEETRIAREVDCVLATSAAETVDLARMGARSIARIPCGVDLAEFAFDAPPSERHRARLRIGTLSRLVPRKGVDLVIDAIAMFDDVELVIAGGGETADLALDAEASRLSSRATAAGVADRTFLRGRLQRHEVAAFLRSCDAIACTPWYEPFGIVALEAMACGVPVIAARVGGLVDTVVDGETGFIVGPRDAGSVASAIAALRVSSTLGRAMGERGILRARSQYAWSHVAELSLAAYRNVLESRTRSSVAAVGE